MFGGREVKDKTITATVDAQISLDFKMCTYDY
jgi:hypothetical protein